MQAYQNILGQAQGVAATPYTPYTGELVAPVNAQQSTGIANINSNWNYAQPYMQTAAGYAQDAATPLTTEQIQQYMSPYTQGVVQATQRQFENQNEQQRQRSVGNAISQGALGGNRQGIAEAELANQQQMAQAPVIAGLYNQAYTTGLNTALTEQQARAQGAYSLGNLGVAGQSAALTGANAQVGAGSLQQGTQQAQDAARYQQFINQQAYPFQTTQWLAGLGTGVGSQMGGTGTSTAPPPNSTAQWLGLGAAGAGAIGQMGGWAALGAMMADGGAVGRASGGVAAPRYQTAPETPQTLKLQQRQLQAGHRRVQMFPTGTPELPMPRGMMRTKNANGTFHYDPRRIDEHEIHRLSTEGRENDMLDLGPYSKDDILKRMHGGEVPVAVVERHPDGTEVRAAIGTHATADRQMAAMNRTKSPSHVVRVEDPRETIGHRIRAIGGRVPGFADGGAPMAEAPPTNGVGAVLAGSPYGGGRGWIPRIDMARGPGAPRVPAGVAPPPTDLAKQAKEIGSLANMIQNPNSGPANTDQNEGAGQSADDENPSMYASGGVANLPYHMMVPHLAEGGSPYDTNYFDESFANPIRHTQDAYDIVSNPDRMQAFGDRARENVMAENPNYVPMPPRRPEGIAPGYDLPPEITAGRSSPDGDQVAMGYADSGVRSRAPRPNVPIVEGDQSSPLDNAAWPEGPIGKPAPGYEAMGEAPRGEPVPPPRGVAPPSGIDLSDKSKLWPSLMAAGFGMMASKSPFRGVAIGEGGLTGMQTYATERQREDRINSEVKKLAQEAEFAQKRLDLATRPYSEQTVDQRARSEEAKRQHERPYTDLTAAEREAAEHRKRTLEETKRFHEQSVRAPKVYTDPDSGEQHALISKIGKDGELEYFDSNLSKGTAIKLSAEAVAASGVSAPVAKSDNPLAPVVAPDVGTVGVNKAVVEAGPYDYRRGAPLIEKGLDVPEPQAIANRSAESIKTDAEKYVLTGQLPTYRSGNSPVAVRDSSYRNAVQNYGNAIAASRGLTPAQLAELHRSAPGMLKFILGPDGRSTVSLGTAVRHLDTVQQLADAWAANDTQAINRLRTVISTQFGASAATNLQAAGSIVGPEIIKAIGVAGAGTAEERAKAEKMFAAASSPEQLRGAVQTVQKLLGGQLEGRKRQAHAAGVPETMFKNLIGERPYEILSHVEGSAKPAQPQKPKTIDQGGHTYTLQPDGSYK